MSEMINKTAPEGNVPLYLFRSGKNSHSYEYMGVHNTVKDGKGMHRVPRMGAERAGRLPLPVISVNGIRKSIRLQRSTTRFGRAIRTNP